MSPPLSTDSTICVPSRVWLWARETSFWTKTQGRWKTISGFINDYDSLSKCTPVQGELQIHWSVKPVLPCNSHCYEQRKREKGIKRNRLISPRMLQSENHEENSAIKLEVISEELNTRRTQSPCLFTISLQNQWLLLAMSKRLCGYSPGQRLGSRIANGKMVPCWNLLETMDINRSTHLRTEYWFWAPYKKGVSYHRFHWLELSDRKGSWKAYRSNNLAGIVFSGDIGKLLEMEHPSWLIWGTCLASWGGSGGKIREVASY